MIEKRKYGLDILRILSMFGIIGLHLFNNGGILQGMNSNSITYYIVLLIYILCYVSVNVFAMLSGFLYIKKQNIQTNKIIYLISVTLFYCLTITGIFYAFNLFNIRESGLLNFIISIFPPLAGRYWYITSYILLFFMIPYINHFVLNISKEKLEKMIIILFILLSILPTIFCLRDFFAINNGYSPFWLMYCYIIGAYVKLYSVQWKNHCWLVLLISNLLSWFLNSLVKFITSCIFGKILLNDIFINYISPLNVISSICLLIIFSSMTLNVKKYRKVIEFFSATSFSVYIIHSHVLVFDYVLKNSFINIVDYNVIIVVLIIILSIFMIYILCSLIDFVRMKIFDLLNVNKLIENNYMKIMKLLSRRDYVRK